MLLHDAFDFHGRGRGDCCFAQCEGKSFTYRAARDWTLTMARALLAAGVGKGDRICLLQRNSIEGLLLIFAASRIGAVMVPLNYRLSPREWIDLVIDAESTTLFADSDFAGQFDTVLADYPVPHPIRKISMADGPAEWQPLADLLALGEEMREIAAPPTGEDIVFQMYTSGTTGRSKGALMSQRAMMANINKSNCATPFRLNPNERSLVALPLFHIAAISTTLCAVAAGACLIIHRDVDPAAIIKSLVEEEIVVASFVPAVLKFLLFGIEGIDEMKFPRLKYVGYGASPIAAPVLRRAIEVFDCHIAQGYGMTEIGGPATLLTEADHRRALENDPALLLSAGKAYPGTEIRVVDAEGKPLPEGEIGEILLRGDDLLTGYWKQPEATDAALSDGWFHSGDAGFLDHEGYLYIRDRIKDLVVTGGENVSSIEVESALLEHPAVSDAAVIGIPHERWGEAVMAILVLDDGASATEEDLDRFCRDKLGGFKIPRRYEFVGALPRNAAGKVLKAELRKPYWEDSERIIG